MPSGRTSSMGYGSPACGSKSCWASMYSRAARNAVASGLPGPSGPSKSDSLERDPFGLQDDGVVAAFEIDRTATGLIGPFVRDHGIGGRAARGRLMRLGELLLGSLDLRADLLQLRLRLAQPLVIDVFQPLEIAARFFVLGKLVAQPPRVVFEVAQLEPGVGQLRFGRRPRLFQLLDAPLDVLALRLDFGP